MTDKIIENLITQLSFKYDAAILKKFNSEIFGISKGLIAIVAGIAGAVGGTYLFTKRIAEANDELTKFGRVTGVDVESLQELGYAAEINGASIDSMNSSLKGLAKIASETARGIGSGVETFGMLGLSVTDASGKIKNAETLLYDVSDSISKLRTEAEQLEFASKLGISSELLLLIRGGSDEIKNLREEAKQLNFVFSEGAGKAAEDFNDQMLKLNYISKGTAITLATKVMKAITPLITAFTEWYKVNHKLIKLKMDKGFEKLGKVLNVVYNVGNRVIRFVDGVAKSMGGWSQTIKVVTAALIVMNASALLMPALIALGAASIFLLLEEIQKFAEGGDTVLGDLIKRFPEMEPYILTLLDLLRMVKDGWVLIFTEGGEVFSGMISMIKDVIQWVKILIGDIKGAGEDLLKLPGKLKQSGIEKAKSFDKAVGVFWKEVFTLGFYDPESGPYEFPTSERSYLYNPNNTTPKPEPIEFKKIFDALNPFKEVDVKAIIEKLPDSWKELLPFDLSIRPEEGGDTSISFLPPTVVIVPQVGRTSSSVVNNNSSNNSRGPVTINIQGGNLQEVENTVRKVLSGEYSTAGANSLSKVEY